MDNQREHLKWFVKDENGITGPLDWMDIEFGVQSGEIPKDVYLKNSMDDKWVLVSEFFSKVEHERSGKNEVRGLIPGSKDALFLLGLVSFFIGVALFFVNPFLGYGILIISLIIEFGSIYLSQRNDPKSITKNIGNIIALVWAGFQGLITLVFIIATIF